ncbi:MAG: response regulator [Verrucomicrobia bacterium]|nr:response regulator [Verrucomicrobiota bacterium]
MTRILIVDDQPENLYRLRALLTGHACEVVEARHGAEALVTARESPPDLVISDLLMPVMDGYTLLRHWKADERLKQIPFVVYTATYTEPKDEQLALDLGADAFIVKPAEPEPFMARLQEVLAKSNAGQITPTHQPVGEEKILLKEYSEVLIRKLEEKTLQLEQANRELATHAAWLRAIFDDEPECVKLLAADGSLKEMNPAGLRMLEADSFQQVENHCVYPLVAEEHRAAFWALSLGLPLSAGVKASSSPFNETAPLWSIIELHFPARGKLPPVKLTWYGGGKQPTADLFLGEKIPANGSLVIGNKGTLLTRDWHGGENEKDMFLLQSRKSFVGYQPPKPTLPRPVDHHQEWIHAFRGGTPTGSNFAYASGKSKQIHDAIRVVIVEMEREENRLLAEREQQARARARFTVGVIGTGGLWHRGARGKTGRCRMSCEVRCA